MLRFCQRNRLNYLALPPLQAGDNPHLFPLMKIAFRVAIHHSARGHRIGPWYRQKQKAMKTLSILLVGFWCVPYGLFAQTVYTIHDKATVKIEGTSTMHDWEMNTRKVSGKAEFIFDGTDVKGIRSLHITIPSESLQSGKGAMDKNAYKALKTDDHKEIRFTLTEVTRVERSGSRFILTCLGKLTIAGTTKEVQLTATCLPGDGGTIQCIGEKAIRMTEYGVEPPSFMFGSVKTGDELQIVFDVVFTKSSQKGIL